MTDTNWQTERQTKPAKAPARKRGGRPRKARGAATSADNTGARWTIRGVPLNVREIVTKAAENRGMTVGDWISEAVVAFSKSDANRVSADVPAVDPPPDFVALVQDMQSRLTKLESRNTRGLLGRLFGKGSVATVVLVVFLISGIAWAEYRAFGGGRASCGEWTEDKNAAPLAGQRASLRRFQLEQWIGGYLTAYSQWVEGGSGPVSDTDNFVGATAWLDNYCQENPLNEVAEAAVQLINAIKAK